MKFLHRKALILLSLLMILSLCNISYGASDCNIIPNKAFENCESLAEFEIPDYVTYIGSRAFYNTGLESVALSEEITYIGAYSFAECGNLKSVYFYNYKTAISSTAFDNTENLVIYCYKNSSAYNFAKRNEIDYVLFDYDIDIIIEDTEEDEDIQISGSSLVITDTFEKDSVKFVSDNENPFEIKECAEEYETKAFGKYLEMQENNGYIEIELNEGDIIYLYSAALSDSAELKIENTENSEETYTAYLSDGISIVKYTAESSAAFKIYVSSGSAGIFELMAEIYEEITYLYGDANYDGRIGIADASLILKKVRNADNITEIEIMFGEITPIDVNGDGSVGIADASLVLKKTRNSEYILPVES